MDIAGGRAAAAMHVAEVLGITYDAVRPSVGDTESIGFTSTTGGSSATFKTGWACYQAAHDVKGQIIERAAKIWEVTPDEVEYTKGVLSDRRNPERRLTFRDLARRLNATGGPIIGRANLAPRGVGAGFGVHIVDVEVDPETGKTQILRYTALQDVGKAIDAIDNQIRELKPTEAEAPKGFICMAQALCNVTARTLRARTGPALFLRGSQYPVATSRLHTSQRSAGSAQHSSAPARPTIGIARGREAHGLRAAATGTLLQR